MGPIRRVCPLLALLGAFLFAAVGCPVLGGSPATMTEVEVCEYVESQLTPALVYQDTLQRTETTYHFERAKYVGAVDSHGSNCWQVHVTATSLRQGLVGDKWVLMPLSLAKSEQQVYYFDELTQRLELKG